MSDEKTRKYQICTETVMDTSDPDITFDKNGVCNHAHRARSRIENECFRDSRGESILENIATKIKESGKGKKYDCVLGLSGGADSSYVAVKAAKMGLRPIAVHLDNGWNTDVAVSNIERILRHYNLDLYTHVVNWQEFRDIQRSLFQSSLPNIEVATDHAIFALLYKVAVTFDIKYILSGSNVETESIMPDAWGHETRDSKSLKSIHKTHGNLHALPSFPFMPPTQFLRAAFVKKIRFLPVLNWGLYTKTNATREMQASFGYEPYLRKHGESRFTRFFQEYYLVQKYGFDKRRAHYSSLIISGQMTRDDALKALDEDLYSPSELEMDIEYVTKKLGFSHSEWAEIMTQPIGSLGSYKHNNWMFNHDSKLVQWIRKSAKVH